MSCQHVGSDDKSPGLEGEHEPDDFLKYFISITAERNRDHASMIGVSLLFNTHSKSDMKTFQVAGQEHAYKYITGGQTGKQSLTLTTFHAQHEGNQRQQG